MAILRYRKFAADDRGASLVEYSILIGLVAAAAITLISAVGGTAHSTWSSLNSLWRNEADRCVTVETEEYKETTCYW